MVIVVHFFFANKVLRFIALKQLCEIFWEWFLKVSFFFFISAHFFFVFIIYFFIFLWKSLATSKCFIVPFVFVVRETLVMLLLSNFQFQLIESFLFSYIKTILLFFTTFKEAKKLVHEQTSGPKLAHGKWLTQKKLLNFSQRFFINCVGIFFITK